MDFDDELQRAVSLYGDRHVNPQGDLDRDLLTVQAAAFKQEFNAEDVDLQSIVAKVQSLTVAKREFYSEICILVKLMLIIPASNAVSERSFSSMKLVKS